MAADILEKFVADGTISREQLHEAQDLAKRKKTSPAQMLVALGYLDEADLAKASGGGKTLDLANLTVPDEVIALVPVSVARENTVLPISATERSVTIAFADPSDMGALQKLEFLLTPRSIDIAPAAKGDVVAAIDRHYGGAGEGGGGADTMHTMLTEITETQIDVTQATLTARDADDEDETAPIIRLVNLIISEAVKMRASDVHIEPFEDRVRIRYRIDGSLVERDSAPRRMLAAMTSRIKIMASMDISEKRRPQDGRIKTRAGGKELDLRVSILPTNHGQACVMRILDRDNIKVGLKNLGFGEENYKTFQNLIRRPNGIFLVTGPTGSGKTTTLYSALGELNRPDRKIITAEDPVEYYLPGINQVEVKHSIGLDFQRIIRAMLRQAPNVILVGEIRDKETAEMAIQASLTGHFVLSTLHTNDAPSSITRLIDMGVQPFLVASSILAVMAQRLVRVVCESCKQPYTPDAGELEYFDITPEEADEATFFKGRGCNKCSHTGYRGRRAVFELMGMNSAIREMTFKGEPAQAIRRQARLFGMRTLVDDAREKAMAGITTLTEVQKLMRSSD
ncbi:GspE/PulE family protein [Alienimonas californiensis]|uniref:Type II/IV secretion system protein n=1 Tax=Alienimonas californiensis TaxID=2527989 RepID=A0A517P7K4_9PLAN|nr:GspE/PulE family protein [Alienimonas californiensis]QDT15348.1 Type II/IV secretion system protein [Alienimonas californiensis]